MTSVERRRRSSRRDRRTASPPWSAAKACALRQVPAERADEVHPLTERGNGAGVTHGDAAATENADAQAGHSISRTPGRPEAARRSPRSSRANSSGASANGTRVGDQGNKVRARRHAAVRSRCATAAASTSDASLRARCRRSASRSVRRGCDGIRRPDEGPRLRPGKSPWRRRATNRQPTRIASDSAGAAPETSMQTSAPRCLGQLLDCLARHVRWDRAVVCAQDLRQLRGGRRRDRRRSRVAPEARAACATIWPGTPRPNTATMSPMRMRASCTPFSATAPICEKMPMRGSAPSGHQAGRGHSRPLGDMMRAVIPRAEDALADAQRPRPRCRLRRSRPTSS